MIGAEDAHVRALERATALLKTLAALGTGFHPMIGLPR
jgi:hypothetical protein